MKTASKSLDEFVAKALWMRRLPASVRDRVISDAYESHHQNDEIVARKGEPARSWIGVAEGSIKASGHVRNGRVVMYSTIPAGAWVGEGSVIKNEMRHYDLIAMGRTRAIHIPRATFRWLLDTNLDFNHFIIDHLNERLAQFMGMVETDRMADPIARLSRAIVGLYSPVLYPGVGPLLKVTQEELGELAGLSRATVNAAIKTLEERGIVRPEYGGLLVCDLAALRAHQEEK